MVSYPYLCSPWACLFCDGASRFIAPVGQARRLRATWFARPRNRKDDIESEEGRDSIAHIQKHFAWHPLHEVEHALRSIDGANLINQNDSGRRKTDRKRHVKRPRTVGRADRADYGTARGLMIGGIREDECRSPAILLAAFDGAQFDPSDITGLGYHSFASEYRPG